MISTYYRVSHGGPDRAKAIDEDFDDEWEAHARYAILVEALHDRHDSAPGREKRWEHVGPDMSTHWNARSIVDGVERNVWFSRMIVR